MPDGLDVTVASAPGRSLATRVTGLGAAVALAAALSGCGAGLAQRPASGGPTRSANPPVSQTTSPPSQVPPSTAPVNPLQNLAISNSLAPFVFDGVTYAVSAGSQRDNPRQGVIVVTRSGTSNSPGASEVLVDTAGQAHASPRGSITLRYQDGRGNVVFGTASGDVGALSLVTGEFSPAG